MLAQLPVLLKVLKIFETSAVVIDEENNSKKKMHFGASFMHKVAVMVLMYLLGVASAVYALMGTVDLNLMMKSDFEDFREEYNRNNTELVQAQLRSVDTMFKILERMEYNSKVSKERDKAIVRNNNLEVPTDVSVPSVKYSDLERDLNGLKDNLNKNLKQ